MIIRVKITRPENRNYFDVTDGEIVHVDLDDYAAGVLAGEVYASWPAETLKAQAVAARSFGVAKARQRMNQTYDVDDTSSYQALSRTISEKSIHKRLWKPQARYWFTMEKLRW